MNGGFVSGNEGLKKFMVGLKQSVSHHGMLNIQLIQEKKPLMRVKVNIRIHSARYSSNMSPIILSLPSSSVSFSQFAHQISLSVASQLVDTSHTNAFASQFISQQFAFYSQQYKQSNAQTALTEFSPYGNFISAADFNNCPDNKQFLNETHIDQIAKQIVIKSIVNQKNKNLFSTNQKSTNIKITFTDLQYLTVYLEPLSPSFLNFIASPNQLEMASQLNHSDQENNNINQQVEQDHRQFQSPILSDQLTNSDRKYQLNHQSFQFEHYLDQECEILNDNSLSSTRPFNSTNVSQIDSLSELPEEKEFLSPVKRVKKEKKQENFLKKPDLSEIEGSLQKKIKFDNNNKMNECSKEEEISYDNFVSSLLFDLEINSEIPHLEDDTDFLGSDSELMKQSVSQISTSHFKDVHLIKSKDIQLTKQYKSNGQIQQEKKNKQDILLEGYSNKQKRGEMSRKVKSQIKLQQKLRKLSECDTYLEEGMNLKKDEMQHMSEILFTSSKSVRFSTRLYSTVLSEITKQMNLKYIISLQEVTNILTDLLRFFPQWIRLQNTQYGTILRLSESFQFSHITNFFSSI